MPNPVDISGQTFGKLTAIRADTTKNIRRWLCICECGKETTVPTNKLTSGHTQSCGCIKAVTTVTNGFKNRVHGRGHGKKDATYSSWTSMRQRCRGGYKDKKDYWERGITVCVRWDSFENFLQDMGERKRGTTLDRIDVNGNYEPVNCRWATSTEQQRNRRNTNYLYFGSERRASIKVADEIGVKKAAMQYFMTVSRKLKEHYGHIPNIEDCLPLDS